MGSTAKGLISGFICRLCSKMNRYVILIYGEEGEKMKLADKINSFLPITVTRNDPLPKTVCPNCVSRLEKHSRMVQMITKVERQFNSQLATQSSKESEGGGEDEDSESEEECLCSDESEVRNGTADECCDGRK